MSLSLEDKLIILHSGSLLSRRFRSAEEVEAMAMRFEPSRYPDRPARRPPDGEAGPRTLPLDAYRRGSSVVVQLDVPGVDPAGIELTVEKNTVVVEAERSFATQKGDEVVVSERPHGRFTRQLSLGDGFDFDAIEAHCDNGVLTITIPVGQEASPRKVAIKTS
jgi:HSP20 family protein